MVYLKFIAVLVPVMLLVDALWIGVLASRFYKSNLGYIMSDSVQWVPAIVFYILYIGALVYFVVLPGVVSGNVTETVLRAMFFGLVAYGTYDLTNHATLKDWPAIVTFVDMSWGSVLTGIIGAIGYYIGRLF